MKSRFFIMLACFGLMFNQCAFASESSKINQDYLFDIERSYGAPYPEMRLSDSMLFRSAYAQGGDLFQQFVRFLFPISGREKRTQFLSSPYWGVKKPRYKKFEWERFESDHFDFYTYPEGQKSLQSVIKYFEEEYERNNRIFGVQNRFEKKIPIVFYQSRRDFEQTSIVDGPIPEGLGGLTEIFGWKRVTFPFEGEKSKFEHVTKHEATHIFQIEKNARRLPLWFIEGSAETNSVYWDADAEMIIRDAYLNGFFFSVSQLWQIQGTWLMYKIGNYITNIIWDEYGEEGFYKIFENADQMGFESNVEKSLGLTIAQLEQKVQAKLLLDYGHLLKQEDVISQSIEIEERKVILDSFEKFYVTGGVVGAQNALFLHYDDQISSDRTTFVVDKQFENESLESFRKGVDITDKQVVYSIKRSRQDELRVQNYTFNPEKKKIKLGEVQAYRWDNIDKIEHPVMVSNNLVYFIGYENGFSNIYKAQLASRKVSKITEDDQHYNHLDYCPGSKTLAFSREDQRDSKYIHYDRHIYTMNLKGELERITSQEKRVHIEPSFSPDCSELLYVSNQPRTYNIFSYNFKNHSHNQITYARVGVKHPYWGPEGTIYFNAYEKMTPMVYQTRYPDTKELMLRSTSLSKDFSIRFPVYEKKKNVSINRVKKDLSVPVLDGLHTFKDRTVIRDGGRAYAVQSVSSMPDKVVVRTLEGLPENDTVKQNRFPHYFEVQGNSVTSLQSNMVAANGIAEDTESWIQSKLKGQGIIQGWTSRVDKKVFVVVNNRLANDYKAHQSNDEIGLYIYDEEKNFLDQLPEGPLYNLDHNIHWVSFLANNYVLIVEADVKEGPYRLIIYDMKQREYFEMSQDASLFKVSEDRTKMIWKSSSYMFLHFNEKDPQPKKIKIDEGKIKNLGILNNGNIGFVAVDQGAIIWIEIEPYSMKAIYTVKKEFEKELIEHVFIHPDGYIAVNTKVEQEESTYKLWVWDVKKDKAYPVRTNQRSISKPISRGPYITFVEKYYYAQPSREFIFHVENPYEVFEFDPENQASIIKDQYWVVEGKRNLSVYDQKQNQSFHIASDPIGFEAANGSLYFSEKEGQYFAIKEFNLLSKKKGIVEQAQTNLIKPVVNNGKLQYLENTQNGWKLSQKNSKHPYLQSVEVIDVEKNVEEDVFVYVKPQKEGSSKKPIHEATADYPKMYLARPSRQKVKLQSLAAAAAYDGSSLRLLVSGFADNLFGDKGVFVNSILLSDTKFAAVGYSDLAKGYNTSAYFNQRSGINNYGINFTKDFIFDRYRQVSAYTEFELQDYEQDSSVQNSFIDPSFDGELFYLLKLGSVYSFDITVRDLHGPITGQRLYFRAETGFNLEEAEFSSYDLNADVRIYNRVLPRFGFAHRLVGGTSQGSIPNLFLVGGNMSFRGVGFDDLLGQNYWVFSEDMRIPVFDFIGAKLFDPLDQMLGFLTRYFDVRSGIYTDIGSVWNNGDPTELKYSVGYFINIPTVFGLMIRLHDGVFGEDNFGFWIGTNW